MSASSSVNALRTQDQAKTSVRVVMMVHQAVRYDLAKRRALRRLRRTPGKPVVVYTIGKTGSSTVLATLRAAVPHRPALQIHHLQPHRVALSEAAYRRLDPPIVAAHVVAAQHAIRHARPSVAAPWDVITLVREPMAQDLSVFFQVAERRGFIRFDAGGNLVEPASVPALHERFLDWRDHEDDARWFDEDFEPSLGIDVYAAPFDPARGFARLDGERARVLLLRNEDLRRVGPAALGDFLGIDPPALVTANVGDDKRYAAIYRAVRSLGMPAELVDRLHATKLAQHFYTAEELAAARAIWVR
jgi:hypothetical protein